MYICVIRTIGCVDLVTRRCMSSYYTVPTLAGTSSGCACFRLWFGVRLGGAGGVMDNHWVLLKGLVHSMETERLRLFTPPNSKPTSFR